MPHYVEISDAHDPQLFDSDTGKSLTPICVVDITDMIPDGERTLLLYTRAERGRIVQVTTPYEREEYMGAHTHFFVDESDGLMRERARRHGLDPDVFVETLRKFAPHN